MTKQKKETARSMMTQITLLRPKADTTDEALTSVFKAAEALEKHIPCLIGVATGENASTFHRGFTHGIILHFEDEIHMRDALKLSIYTRMFEKVRDLCEQTVIFEVSETLPFVVAEAVPTQVIQRVVREEPKPIQEELKPRQEEPKPIQEELKPRQEEPKPIQEELKPRQEEPTFMPAKRVKSQTPRPVVQAPAPVTSSRRRTGEPIRQRVSRAIDVRLKNIIVEQLGVDEAEVVHNASFVEDLNADSLDLVELIMSFEEVFNVHISDEDAEKLTTVEETQEFLIDNGAIV